MTYPNVFIFDHPLIKHKVSILRDKNTSMKEFRELVEEITTIMTYESMRDVELVPVEVETPSKRRRSTAGRGRQRRHRAHPARGARHGQRRAPRLSDGKVGHIGMYRNEETLEPQEYYCKLPDGIAEKTVFLIDPMLATGGSACDAIAALKARGCKRSSSWRSSPRPRASKSSTASTPTCLCMFRRSTAASTRTATSCPASAARG